MKKEALLFNYYIRKYLSYKLNLNTRMIIIIL
jgi:hypothetical protein